MGGVTTNPWLITVINMTVVFGVLIILGLIMSAIRIFDPTKKKEAAPAKVETAKAAAPVAAARQDDKAVVAAIAASLVAASDEGEVVAAIAAAITAYGYSSEQIVCIRRLPSTNWILGARRDAVNAGRECF